MGVFIAIPTLTGHLRSSITTGVVSAIRASRSPYFPWTFSLGQSIGKSPVSEARHDLITSFLSNDKCQWIWFWDDDQDVPINFLDMLDYTDSAKIISGLVWMWKSESPPHAKMLTSHGDFSEGGEMLARTEVPSREPYFVDAAGTGFLLVHRSVIEALSPRPFGTKQTITEDLDFCRKANAIGERVLIVPSVNPAHIKSISLNDIYDYSRSLATYAVEKYIEASDPKPA